jgi:hypothetical protein
MLNRYLTTLHTEIPGDEADQAIRDRLKASFPPGSARRMTVLGMLVGHCIQKAGGAAASELVYASVHGEGLALEAFLDSFPTPSPTLFQTSIHPSGAQQGLIAARTPVSTFLPLAGGPFLGGQALLAACLSQAPRVLLCAGEERGGWLRPFGATGSRHWAFALALETEPSGAPLGRLQLTQDPSVQDGLELQVLPELLGRRDPFAGPACPGWQLELSWS